MRCRQALDAVVSGWGTGDALPDPVREHLDTCEACARESALIREALEGVSALAVPDPGEEYWDRFLPRLRTRIAQAPPEPARGRLDLLVERLFSASWAPARLAAAAALAVIMAGAALSGWGRLGGSQAGSPGSAAIEKQLDAELLAAADEEALAVEDTISASISTDPAEEESVDPDSLQQAVGEVVASLSPGSTRGWDELDDWLEDLSGDESKALLEQLAPEAGEGSGDAKEEPKG